MTRIATPEEIETIRAYPTVEQADAESRDRDERRKRSLDSPPPKRVALRGRGVGSVG